MAPDLSILFALICNLQRWQLQMTGIWTVPYHVHVFKEQTVKTPVNAVTHFIQALSLQRQELLHDHHLMPHLDYIA